MSTASIHCGLAADNKVLSGEPKDRNTSYEAVNRKDLDLYVTEYQAMVLNINIPLEIRVSQEVISKELYLICSLLKGLTCHVHTI